LELSAYHTPEFGLTLRIGNFETTGRVTRLAWLNGLRRLAEFEFGLAGVDGVACGVA
jgi:hypothetical protein